MPEGIVESIMGSFGFSMGTKNAPRGVAQVAEDGAELVFGKSVRNFQGGETVLNKTETRRMLGGDTKIIFAEGSIVVKADDMRKAADFFDMLEEQLPLHAMMREVG